MTKRKSASTRTEPAVWIRRLVIFRAIDPIETVREVPLHRGLNIVWGKDEDDEDDGDVAVVGHGVGKTSFCRLLRYCLGEPNFARNAVQQRIRATFRQGYVAAEVMVAGGLWSVARPIGFSGRHYAARDLTIEQLLDERKHHEHFEVFRTTVEDSVLADLVSGMTVNTKQAIRWEHMLAWCARDQEARYQNLWTWRSPRSDSGTVAFKRPREDPLYVMRAVMGLLTGDEVEFQERLAELDADAKAIEHRLMESQREPDYWCRNLKRKLSELLGTAIDDGDGDGDDRSLFSPENQVAAAISRITQELQDRQDQLESIENELGRTTFELQERDAAIRFNESLLATSKQATEETRADVRDRQEERQVLTEVGEQMCRYGRVLFKDCQHVHHRLQVLQISEIADQDHAVAATEDRQQAQAQIESDLTKLRNDVAEFRTSRQRLLTERQRLATEIRERRARHDSLADTTRELQRWQRIRSGEQPNSALAELTAKQKATATAQSETRNQLATLLARHEAHISSLAKQFDQAVKSVLSPDYAGRVTFENGELSFEITRGDALAGEAIETLTVLLADVCAANAAATGIGHHPGLVILDSPREADLGPSIYRSYLRFLATTVGVDGESSSPFQIIVTTTTPPPASLRHPPTLVLTLERKEAGDAESGLLFGCTLSPIAQNQPPLLDWNASKD